MFALIFKFLVLVFLFYIGSVIFQLIMTVFKIRQRIKGSQNYQKHQNHQNHSHETHNSKTSYANQRTSSKGDIDAEYRVIKK